MKTAFLFPGQGSQYVGMGQDIYNSYPEARSVFEEAGSALGQDLGRLCFEGSEKELGLTINTQPAILTTSIAIFRVLQKADLYPHVVAGHSLGEYSALVAAGVITLAEGVKIVRARAGFMQEAVEEGKAGMAAILGWSEDGIFKLLKELQLEERVFVANLNCPEQIVVAGIKDSLLFFLEKAQGCGAKRCVILDVSVPSHCPMMKQASEALEGYLKPIPMKTPQIPIVTNADAKIVTQEEEIRSSLVRQLSSPVRWEESMRLLIAEGAELFLEVGPGKVLSNLLRRIDKQVKSQTTGDLNSLQQALAFSKSEIKF